MAKRKKNRPTAARPGSASKTATGIATGPRVAPAEPGGPNRAARKEEARRQREAIQKRMSRRRIYRIVAVVVALLVVAGAITAYQLTRPSPLVAASCAPTQRTKAYTASAAAGLSDRAHVPAQNRPSLSTYPTVPPASGPHDGTPLNAGAYPTPPDPYQAIHSLEHGAVIVWYRPGANASELRKIQDFYQQTANADHVIVAPYLYQGQGQASQLPAGKDMVLVAWHRFQSCSDLSLGVVQSFAKSYRTPTGVTKPPGYKGEAPEAGRPI